MSDNSIKKFPRSGARGLKSPILLGRKQTLKAAWKVDFGMYLEGDEEGKILLPTRYVPEGLEVGDEVEVFVYLDNEERRIATTIEPLAQVGDIACLEVAWVNEYGAFLNWGLMKDLFCPFREQKMRMQQGRKYIVHVHEDEESYRIMASAKIDKWLQSDARGLKVGDKVPALILQKTDLGFKAVINPTVEDQRAHITDEEDCDRHPHGPYGALLYDNQVFKQIHAGDRVEAYVSNIRPDGKIDISLQKQGREHTEDFAEHLLRYLQYRGGRCRLGDKSSPQEIYEQFQVSKKTYKKAIGDLYKRRLITINEDGIELV